MIWRSNSLADNTPDNLSDVTHKCSQMRSCFKVFTRLFLFLFADSLNLEEAIGNHMDSVTGLKLNSQAVKRKSWGFTATVFIDLM